MFYEHNPNSAGSSQLLLANDGVVTQLVHFICTFEVGAYLCDM